MSGKQEVQSCDCSACFSVVRIKKNQLKNLTLTLITKHSYSKKYSLEMMHTLKQRLTLLDRKAMINVSRMRLFAVV